MFGQSESAAVTGGIKLVLFDMDNVLCDYDRAKRVAWLSKLAGTTSESVHKAIWDSGFELLGDSGTLDAADYLRGFGDRIGYPEADAALNGSRGSIGLATISKN